MQKEMKIDSKDIFCFIQASREMLEQRKSDLSSSDLKLEHLDSQKTEK